MASTIGAWSYVKNDGSLSTNCLLYTSDAADE